LTRALIHKSPLLFLDDSISNLDPESAQQVNDLISNLSHAPGRTVVLVIHNLLDAQRLCDRVATMNSSTILTLGSLDELLHNLWPAIWGDIVFHVKPKVPVPAAVKGYQCVNQFSVAADPFSVQVENVSVVHDLIRLLIEKGASLYMGNPLVYTLKYICFALHCGCYMTWLSILAINQNDLMELKQNQAAWIRALALPLIIAFVMPTSFSLVPQSILADKFQRPLGNVEVLNKNLPPTMKTIFHGLKLEQMFVLCCWQVFTCSIVLDHAVDVLVGYWRGLVCW